MPKSTQKSSLPKMYRTTSHVHDSFTSKQTLREAKELFGTTSRRRVRREAISAQQALVRGAENPLLSRNTHPSHNGIERLNFQRLSTPARLLVTAAYFSSIVRLDPNDAVPTFTQGFSRASEYSSSEQTSMSRPSTTSRPLEQQPFEETPSSSNPQFTEENIPIGTATEGTNTPLYKHIQPTQLPVDKKRPHVESPQEHTETETPPQFTEENIPIGTATEGTNTPLYKHIQPTQLPVDKKRLHVESPQEHTETETPPQFTEENIPIGTATEGTNTPLYKHIQPTQLPLKDMEKEFLDITHDIQPPKISTHKNIPVLEDEDDFEATVENEDEPILISTKITIETKSSTRTVSLKESIPTPHVSLKHTVPSKHKEDTVPSKHKEDTVPSKHKEDTVISRKKRKKKSARSKNLHLEHIPSLENNAVRSIPSSTLLVKENDVLKKQKELSPTKNSQISSLFAEAVPLSKKENSVQITPSELEEILATSTEVYEEEVVSEAPPQALIDSIETTAKKDVLEESKVSLTAEKIIIEDEEAIVEDEEDSSTEESHQAKKDIVLKVSNEEQYQYKEDKQQEKTYHKEGSSNTNNLYNSKESYIDNTPYVRIHSSPEMPEDIVSDDEDDEKNTVEHLSIVKRAIIEEHYEKSLPEQKEDNSIVHRREKRDFTDPTRPLKEIIAISRAILLNDPNTAIYFNRINEYLKYDKTLVIWSNPNFKRDFLILHSLSETILAEKLNGYYANPDRESDKISIEVFSQLTTRMIDENHREQALFFDMLDKKPNPDIGNTDILFIPTHESFLQDGIKMARLSTLMYLLDPHPTITPLVLAKLSATTYQTLEADYISSQGWVYDLIKPVFSKINADIINNSPVSVPAPIFYSQNDILSPAVHLGKYGFCAPLASSFDYYLYRYGIDDGIVQMQKLLDTLSISLQKVGAKELMQYHKAITVLGQDTEGGHIHQILLQEHEFPRPFLYKKNIQNSLSVEYVAKMLFDDAFAPGKTFFHIRPPKHVISAVRTYEPDKTNPDNKICTIHYFDANTGYFSTTKKQDIIDMLNEIRYGSPQNPDCFTITCVKPVLFAQSVTRYGTSAMDFINRKIIGNPTFLPPLVDDIPVTKKMSAEAVSANHDTGYQKFLSSFYQELLHYKEEMTRSATLLNINLLPPTIDPNNPHDPSDPDFLQHISDELKKSQFNSGLQTLVNDIQLVNNYVKTNVANMMQNHAGVDPDFDILLEHTLDSVIRLENKLKEQPPAIQTNTWSFRKYFSRFLPTFSPLQPSVGEGILKHTTLNFVDNPVYEIPTKNPKNTLSIDQETLVKNKMWDPKESQEIVDITRNLDTALDNLIRSSNLDPNDFIAPDIEVVKLAATTVDELSVLKKDYIDIVNVKTKDVKRFSLKGTQFKVYTTKLHNKLLQINKRADIIFKGMATYSSVTTIMHARSMIDQGRVFNQMTTNDKLSYVPNTVDATVDLTANVAGAVNKVVKVLYKPMKTLSQVSRVASKISAGIGLVATAIKFSVSAAEYAKDPSTINQINLIFDGVDVGFSTTMAVFPASAVIILPISLIVNAIRENILREVKIKEIHDTIDSIIRQLESEYIGQMKTNNILVKDGFATFTTMAGDIIKITLREDEKLVLTLTPHTAQGFHIAEPNLVSPNNPAVPSNRPLVKPLSEGIVFPHKECLKSASVQQTEQCLPDKLEFAPEFCSDPKQGYYQTFYSVSKSAGQGPITLNNLAKAPASTITEVIPVKEEISQFLLQPQYITYSKVWDYSYEYRKSQAFSYGSSQLDIENGIKLTNKYKNKPNVHKLAQCSSFDAIRATSVTKNLPMVYHESKEYGLDDTGWYSRVIKTPIAATWAYAASYLSSCYIAGPQKMTIDTSTSNKPPLLILPPDEISSLRLDKDILPLVRELLRTYKKYDELHVIARHNGIYLTFTGIYSLPAEYLLNSYIVAKYNAKEDPYASHKSHITIRVPLPFYYSRDNEIMERTGCSIDPDNKDPSFYLSNNILRNHVPIYNSFTIHAGGNAPTSILLQGYNEIKLLPPTKAVEKSAGFILFAEEILVPKENYTPSDILIVTPEIDVTISKNMKIIRIGSVLVNISELTQDIPIFVRTSSGFLLSWDYIKECFLPILHNHAIHAMKATDETNRIHVTELDGVALARTIMNTYLLPTFKYTTAVQPYPFPIKGLILESYTYNGNKAIPPMDNAVYVSKQGYKDKVVFLHLYKTVLGMLETVNLNDYQLLHIDEDLYDYPGAILENKEHYTAYFYNPKDKKLLVQKSENILTDNDFEEQEDEPEFVIFEGGIRRLLVNGVATHYDTNGSPIERRIKVPLVDISVTGIDPLIEKTMEEMSVADASLPHDRKVVLYEIPYRSATGKMHAISGEYTLSRRCFGLLIPEYQGKEMSLLSRPIQSSTGQYYSYYFAKEKDADGNILHSLLYMPAVDTINPIEHDGAIDETKLQGVKELFKDIKIDSIFSREDAFIIKTTEGIFLHAVLDGEDSYTSLLTLSQQFIESRGYTIDSPDDIRSALFQAEALYGKSIAPLLEITKDSSSSSYVDTRTHVVIPSNRENFYKLPVGIHKAKLFAKPLKTRSSRDVGHVSKKIIKRDVDNNKKQSATTEDSTIKEFQKIEALNPLLIDYTIQGYLFNFETGVKTACLWDKASRTFVVSPESPTEDNPARTYFLASYECMENQALIQMSPEHSQTDTIGIVVPGATSLTIVSSNLHKDIRLHYTHKETFYLNEILLQHRTSNERLPQCTFEADERMMGSIALDSVRIMQKPLSKDMQISILKQDASDIKPQYMKIILKHFFSYPENNNPYNGVITINGKSYSSSLLILEAKKSRLEAEQKAKEQELEPIQEVEETITL